MSNKLFTLLLVLLVLSCKSYKPEALNKVENEQSSGNTLVVGYEIPWDSEVVMEIKDGKLVTRVLTKEEYEKDFKEDKK